MILALYVDDVIIIHNSLSLLQETKQYLSKEFEMVDMRPLQYFLGIKFKGTWQPWQYIYININI